MSDSQFQYEQFEPFLEEEEEKGYTLEENDQNEFEKSNSFSKMKELNSYQTQETDQQFQEQFTDIIPSIVGKIHDELTIKICICDIYTYTCDAIVSFSNSDQAYSSSSDESEFYNDNLIEIEADDDQNLYKSQFICSIPPCDSFEDFKDYLQKLVSYSIIKANLNNYYSIAFDLSSVKDLYKKDYDSLEVKYNYYYHTSWYFKKKNQLIILQSK
ncbi:UNKNOWN [Stylonychia lemnae]|uniref:Uncharacterized protein n=1 Tax=Stylonychia lemnae TaxID=5949 RepID=A0A078AD08_STYLE|nr:UNKNOWN [Stylonychia lemnae]|eukprot:CDW78743.1 UNKNOWN [Stylonychia lemnae]